MPLFIPWGLAALATLLGAAGWATAADQANQRASEQDAYRRMLDALRSELDTKTRELDALRSVLGDRNGHVVALCAEIERLRARLADAGAHTYRRAA